MPDCLFRRLWRLGEKLIKEKPNFLGLHDGARSFGQRAFKDKTAELRDAARHIAPRHGWQQAKILAVNDDLF